MPTSRMGFSVCLVPSHEDILGGHVEKQLCSIMHDKNTNNYSFLVHQRDILVLGGESDTNFLSNLAMFCQAKPYFVAKLSSFVAVSTGNATMQDCI